MCSEAIYDFIFTVYNVIECNWMERWHFCGACILLLPPFISKPINEKRGKLIPWLSELLISIMWNYITMVRKNGDATMIPLKLNKLWLDE